MNVNELRKRLAGVPGHLDVVVRASADDGTSICNTPWNAGPDNACQGGEFEPFFAIEVSETDDEPVLQLAPGSSTS